MTDSPYKRGHPISPEERAEALVTELGGGAMKIGSMVFGKMTRGEKMAEETRRLIAAAIHQHMEETLITALEEDERDGEIMEELGKLSDWGRGYERRAQFGVSKIKEYIRHLQALILVMQRDNGYADGYEAGKRDGYTKGKEDGWRDGYWAEEKT